MSSATIGVPKNLIASVLDVARPDGEKQKKRSMNETHQYHKGQTLKPLACRARGYLPYSLEGVQGFFLVNFWEFFKTQ